MALTASNIQLKMTEYPLFAQFLGYVVLGQIPQEVSDLVDQMSDDDIPHGYQFIAHMWQNRNRDPEMYDEILEYIRQVVRDTMP